MQVRLTEAGESFLPTVQAAQQRVADRYAALLGEAKAADLASVLFDATQTLEAAEFV